MRQAPVREAAIPRPDVSRRCFAAMIAGGFATGVITDEIRTSGRRFLAGVAGSRGRPTR